MGRFEPGADPRGDRGRRAEGLAAAHLERRGYRILARNLRVGGVELDIVAVDPTHLVFVEVRSRSSLRYGRPEESVGRRKQQRLIRGARAYLREFGRERRPCRFDVVGVWWGPPVRLTLLRDAFRVSG